MRDGDTPDPRDGPRAAISWFLRTDNGVVLFFREMLSSALAVALVGLVLFAASGLWPPLVAVESGSMDPHLKKGDLVFVMEEHRFAPDAAYTDTGVVTYTDGKDVGYTKFHSYGDVVVYERDGRNNSTPVIHRARFWVNESENWYGKADPAYLDPAWDNCEELPNCPAPNSGFVTKGDANPLYDQVWGISKPVHPTWIQGTAEFRVPWLGWIRLIASGQSPTLALLDAGHVVDPATATTGVTSTNATASNATASNATAVENIPATTTTAAATMPTATVSPVSASETTAEEGVGAPRSASSRPGTPSAA
ncbi:S26 family signal peptidase [Halocalculus aciditolerans]|uniref:Signal peptidase I n=1 Tax=Halocalculus aciditolerans TaxID=1383812 RepID=A0A830F1K0_9EURY|nr:S26 family signal peptidase [Halocalculus aciditolerans]GGL46113.1 hypothetical protein GCM10009039_00620 [Halocalculus aciditolerans]